LTQLFAKCQVDSKHPHPSDLVLYAEGVTPNLCQVREIFGRNLVADDINLTNDLENGSRFESSTTFCQIFSKLGGLSGKLERAQFSDKLDFVEAVFGPQGLHHRLIDRRIGEQYVVMQQ